MQYTLRNIPGAVDAELRRRARRSGRSLNELAVEALQAGLGLGPEPRRDLADIVGAMPRDATLDAALEAQRQVDPDLWR